MTIAIVSAATKSDRTFILARQFFTAQLLKANMVFIAVDGISNTARPLGTFAAAQFRAPATQTKLDELKNTVRGTFKIATVESHICVDKAKAALACMFDAWSEDICAPPKERPVPRPNNETLTSKQKS